MDIRRAILNEMDERDLTRYRVMKLLDGRVPQTTLYGFLRGEHPVNSDALGHIMGAVGLTIAPTTPTAGRKGRAK